MAGYCAVFIDGGYLDKVMHYDFGTRRVDYERLSQELAAPADLLRAYYYNCLPYRGNPPTEEEKERYSNMHRFITKLNFLNRYEVRLGRLVKRGIDELGFPVFQQKRVDCMVGVDMASLAAKGKITNVALLTGDSDLIPAVEAVKRESVLVTLWHGSTRRETRPSQELIMACDEEKEITIEMVERIERRP